MGRRGVSYHVRGKPTFEQLGVPHVVLASNRTWTSFAPIGDPPNGDALAAALAAPVLEIWSDDDAGTTLAFFTPDGWSAELTIALGDNGPPGRSDRALLAKLAKGGIVTDARGAKLAAHIARADRGAWIASDGVENVLEVPYVEPLPVPLTRPLLRKLGISAKVVKPAPKRAARTPAKAKASVARANVDANILALHVHYWSELFQRNTWKLYNRYKKHLPAERRREVDDLCNHVAMGSEGIPQAVEQILATIWKDDDWVAAIRDPEIVAFEPLDDEQRADWQQRLAQLGQ